MMIEQLELALSPQAQVTLFQYQEQVIEEVHQAIADGKRVITVAAATGSGKTVMASALKQDFIIQGKRVLFVVHRDVLIQQTAKTLQRFGITPGIIAGGYKPTHAKVQVASVQTLGRRKPTDDWDVVIFDEAHITAWTTWGKKVLAELGDRHAILLTATPFRLSKRESFSQISDCLVKAPGLKELIEMERLSRPRYMVAGTIDTSKVRTQAGEFSSEDLSVICDNEEVIQNFCKALLTHGKGRLTLAFAVGVNHAKRIAEIANKNGIRAAHVDGEMSREHRRNLYEALANRELDLLASCEALAEGFDVPSVDCVGLLRPTKSKAKYIQQVGRGLRSSPGKKDCLVLCQSGNIHRLGFVEDIPIKFQKPNDKEPGAAPTKTCWEVIQGGQLVSGCNSIIHASLRFCPHCGGEFPSKEEEKVKFTGEWREVKRSQSKSKSKKVDTKLQELWEKILSHVEQPSTRALLKQHGSLDTFKDNLVRINIKTAPLLRMAEWKQSVIEKAVAKAVGKRVVVILKTPTPSPSPTPTPRIKHRQSDPWQEVVNGGIDLLGNLISSFLK